MSEMRAYGKYGNAGRVSAKVLLHVAVITREEGCSEEFQNAKATMLHVAVCPLGDRGQATRHQLPAAGELATC